MSQFPVSSLNFYHSSSNNALCARFHQETLYLYLRLIYNFVEFYKLLLFIIYLINYVSRRNYNSSSIELTRFNNFIVL